MQSFDLSKEKKRIADLLQETISLVCQNSLKFTKKFMVEGLLGITLDDKDVILVNVKHVFENGMNTKNNPVVSSNHLPNKNLEADISIDNTKTSCKDSIKSSPSVQEVYTSTKTTNYIQDSSLLDKIKDEPAWSDQIFPENTLPNPETLDSQSSETNSQLFINVIKPTDNFISNNDTFSQISTNLYEPGSQKLSSIEHTETSSAVQEIKRESAPLESRPVITVSTSGACAVPLTITTPITHLQPPLTASPSLTTPSPLLLTVPPLSIPPLPGEKPLAPASSPAAAAARYERRVQTGARRAPLSQSIRNMQMKLLSCPGCFVTARSVYRNSSARCVLVNHAMELLHGDRHLGRLVNIRFQKRVFYKCPPHLVRATALRRLGFTPDNYRLIYQQDPTDYYEQSSTIKSWPPFIRSVLKHCPYPLHYLPICKLNVGQPLLNEILESRRRDFINDLKHRHRHMSLVANANTNLTPQAIMPSDLFPGALEDEWRELYQKKKPWTECVPLRASNSLQSLVPLEFQLKSDFVGLNDSVTDIDFDPPEPSSHFNLNEFPSDIDELIDSPVKITTKPIKSIENPELSTTNNVYTDNLLGVATYIKEDVEENDASSNFLKSEFKTRFSDCLSAESTYLPSLDESSPNTASCIEHNSKRKRLNDLAMHLSEGKSSPYRESFLLKDGKK